MRLSITAWLRQPHDAMHNQSILQTEHTEHPMQFQKESFEEHSEGCGAKSTVRPSLRNRLGRMGGCAGSDTKKGFTRGSKDSKSKRRNIWGNFVNNVSRARAAIAGTGTKDYFPKNGPHQTPHAPVICTDTLNNA